MIFIAICAILCYNIFMDMHIKVDNRYFEWDENKNTINKKKHGISFELAATVFGDDNRLEIYDDEHSIDEERYKVIGYIGKYLCVAFTERREFTRLISARKATPRERRMYDEYNS